MERKLKLGDLYAATFVDLGGVPPDLEVVRGKTLLIFPAEDRVYELLNQYNSGAPCSALDFVDHMKALRARMLDAKRAGAEK